MRICSTRPRYVGKSNRQSCVVTRYTTLARSSAVPRRFLQPVSFLVHLSGLTVGSMMIPIIQSRCISSNREEKQEELDQDGSIGRPAALPPPQPSPIQLRRLSSILRNQITSVRQGVDALFTLRQLHMLKRPSPPSLPALPWVESPPPELVLVQEKWLWRLPASAAIHSILRNRDERLVQTAVELAKNALRWDRLIWEALIVQDGMKVKEDRYGFKKGDGKELPPIKLVTTSERQITISDSSTQHPLHLATSSLSNKTLELLFLFLAQTPNRTAETSITALHLAFSILHLSFACSKRMYWHTFKICLQMKREDLAVLAWEAWYNHVQKSGEGKQQVNKAFVELRRIVRPHRTSFQFSPSLRTLAAVSHLTRMLEHNNRSLEPSTSLTADLVQLLANFPPPWRAPLMQRESRVKEFEFNRIELHLQVSKMVKGVLIGMIENIIGRKILKLQSGYQVDVIPSHTLSSFKRAIWSTTTMHASLLKFSLEILQSQDVATHLLDQIPEKVLEHSPHIHNILLQNASLSIRPPTNKSAPENDYTMPITILFLTRISRFIDLDRIVFTLLPELDLRSFSTDSAVLARAVIPPPPGRSPYLYTTLLDALRKAGRTGLAERVFRSARWASQLSQTDSIERPWRLPPAIFTIMLQLYASEAKKGTLSTEELNSSLLQNRNVVGWGRHALRVLFIERNKEVMRKKLDSTVELRGRRSTRSLDFPSMTRSAAAPIVAEWELESGSNETEAASLKLALRSPFSRKALITLFPERPTSRKRKVWRRIIARNALARAEGGLK